MYCGLIQTAKMIFSRNYAVGKQVYHFLKELRQKAEFDFRVVQEFENGVLNSIFKDYNVQRRQKEWMFPLLPLLLDELVSLKVV